MANNSAPAGVAASSTDMAVATDMPLIDAVNHDEAIEHGVVSHPGTVADAEHAAGHQTLLGLDSYAWVGVAFLCFLLLLWKFGAFRALGAALDGKAVRVRADLAEAAQLKADAERIMREAAAESARATEDARAMIAAAEVEAQRIVAQAAADADVAISRRTRLAQERIAAEARAAEDELRARAADITVQAAAALLAERAGRGELGGLTDAAIAGIDRH